MPINICEKTLHENICFCVREIWEHIGADQAKKSYMKIVMDFVERYGMENRIFACIMRHNLSVSSNNCID